MTLRTERYETLFMSLVTCNYTFLDQWMGFSWEAIAKECVGFRIRNLRIR
jgi:hypothetical protein